MNCPCCDGKLVYVNFLNALKCRDCEEVVEQTTELFEGD